MVNAALIKKSCSDLNGNNDHRFEKIFAAIFYAVTSLCVILINKLVSCLLKQRLLSITYTNLILDDA